jgi:hypothetical protein
VGWREGQAAKSSKARVRGKKIGKRKGKEKEWEGKE